MPVKSINTDVDICACKHDLVRLCEQLASFHLTPVPSPHVCSPWLDLLIILLVRSSRESEAHALIAFFLTIERLQARIRSYPISAVPSCIRVVYIWDRYSGGKFLLARRLAEGRLVPLPDAGLMDTAGGGGDGGGGGAAAQADGEGGLLNGVLPSVSQSEYLGAGGKG